MATTFDVTNFKNVVLGWITGTNATGASPLYYCNFYNGSIAASPTTAPGGSLVFSTISQGPTMSAKWTAADNNATAFNSVNVAAATPAGAAGVSSLTFARFYNSSQAASVDTSLSATAGAGIGVVVDNTTSTAGVGPTITNVSFKFPTSNGATMSLSLPLAQRLVDLCTGVSSPAASTVPQFGINSNGGCVINVYSGSVPANADAPIGGGNTLLITFTVGASNLWAAASGGSSAMAGAGLTANAVAGAPTTATFARMVKTHSSGNNYTIQGVVGTVGSGADFILSSTSITSGNSYTMSDCVISL